MAEPQAGPSGASSVPTSDERTLEVGKKYHDQLETTIESFFRGLEKYLGTVHQCKLEVDLVLDTDDENPQLESAFLRETLGYIESLYADVKDLERVQRELTATAQGATEPREQRTAGERVSDSRSLVALWLDTWWPTFLSGPSSEDQRDGANENDKGAIKDSAGDVAAGAGDVAAGAGDVAAGAGDVAGQRNERDELAVAVGEVGEGGTDEQSSNEATYGNSNGISSDGYADSSSKEDNGNGLPNDGDSGNGIPETLEAALTTYSPRSAKRLVATDYSVGSLLGEVYRQAGMVRRELQRHIDRMWFVIRVRHQERGGGPLAARMAKTLDAIQLELFVARMDMAGRAGAVRRYSEVMWPSTPDESSTPEAAGSVQISVLEPEQGFFRRLLVRVWNCCMRCIPRRRDSE